jgi:hypothetical protein
MQKIITCPEAKKLGVTRYFTGKPCCHGHVVERRTDNYNCIDCARLHSQSELKRQLNREHYKANSDEIKNGHAPIETVSERGILACSKEPARAANRSPRRGAP